MSMPKFVSSFRSLAQRRRWGVWLATSLAIALIAAAGWFLVGRSTALQAQSGMNCSGSYLIDVTLPTGGRWEMCWEHRQAEGIVFYDVHFTPVGGPRRKILAQANVAQIHVPYDDNGARFHDLSDYGLGDTRMNDLTQADCPNGTLLAFGAKNVLCMQVEPRGYAYKYYGQQLQGYQLSLFSVSHIGQYNYIPVWRFADNGAIEPSVGATGKLQRVEYNSPQYGWPVRTDGGGLGYAISHMHNYYWRLDFDIDGTPNNDLVEEFEFTPTNQNSTYSISVNPMTTEAARTVNPTRMRSWRIRDTSTTNAEGHPISYHLEPLRVGHIHQGPANEPFTNNQFYVTVNNPCEKWVSHNPPLYCGEDVSQYVNGQGLSGQDLVLWYGITFHHVPRDEDEVMMDAHWDGFQIIPRD
jgi:primary-amine oxidase